MEDAALAVGTVGLEWNMPLRQRVRGMNLPKAIPLRGALSVELYLVVEEPFLVQTVYQRMQGSAHIVCTKAPRDGVMVGMVSRGKLESV